MRTVVRYAGRHRIWSAVRNVRLAAAVMPVLVLCHLTHVHSAESAATQPQGQLLRREGQGSLLQIKEQKVLMLKGAPYEVGFQHGKLLAREAAEDLRAFIHEWAGGKRGLTLSQLKTTFDSLKPFIPKRYMEEMRGLADGAGLPLNEIHLLHAIPTRFHCTGAAAFGKATADGRLYHTRSLDYSLDIGDDKTVQENAIVMVCQPDEGNAHAVLSWAGFIGCVSGMNAEGISIGEIGNSCRDESDSGMPMVFMLREVLRTCNALEEVIRFIEKAPRTCGFTFIVGDGKVPSACALEVSHSQMAVGLPGDKESNPPPHFPIADAVRRGNYFVDKKMAAIQRDIYDPAISSPADWMGYSVMSDCLQENYGRLDDLKMIELLRKYPPEHPCLHQAVFCPSTVEFWVSNAVSPAKATFAGAQNQPFFKFDLRKLIAEIPFEAKVARPSPTLPESLPPPESGTVAVSEREEFLSEPRLSRFRLKRKEFPWTLRFDFSGEKHYVATLSFPSEVETTYPEVNTVLAEYYLPKTSGKVPAVIVLDILEGDFLVARTFSRALAGNGIAALAMHMPYFGKRRPKGEPEAGMFSGGISLARDVMTQAVQDIRCAALWLRSREEVDPDRVGIVGVSLGATIGGLALGVDGTFANSALILGGGDVANIIWTSPETARVKERLVEEDYTLDRLRKELAPVDPLTYADRIDPRKVMMVNARKDRTVPNESTLKLWEKAGRPKIVWYNTTHVGLSLYVAKVIEEAVAFIRGELSNSSQPGS